MHDIVYVKSVGNTGTIDSVTSPGLSHNGITVGSLDYLGSSYISATSSHRSYFSSYTSSNGNNIDHMVTMAWK